MSQAQLTEALWDAVASCWLIPVEKWGAAITVTPKTSCHVDIQTTKLTQSKLTRIGTNCRKQQWKSKMLQENVKQYLRAFHRHLALVILSEKYQKHQSWSETGTKTVLSALGMFYGDYLQNYTVHSIGQRWDSCCKDLDKVQINKNLLVTGGTKTSKLPCYYPITLQSIQHKNAATERTFYSKNLFAVEILAIKCESSVHN